MLGALRANIDAKRQAHAEALVLRGRFATRSSVEVSMNSARREVEQATAALSELRLCVKQLGYRPEDLEAASNRRSTAAKASQRAEEAAQMARLEGARRRERANGAAARAADAEGQHAKLADLESKARHLSRTAELLARFRDTVVASVGPRLAQQAAALFGELTDNEYEGIEVDPDTYQLQIRDGGQVYGLDRFSGSEIDLANLALRVAISEHINFQSGGAVGLLVLDEVFGPLDDDRKARMLIALERLRGRFRQILVVTHDTEIKEQLPNALEVVKLPGRRATARLVGD
jgi:exonuclease SbcC